MSNWKINSKILFLILFLSCKVGLAQELTMLDNVLAFTSSDDFIANNIFNVVGKNFSDDGSINLVIEGDLSSYEYSLALISMLPAFEKSPKKKNLRLGYSNLNEENLNEAIIIEGIRTLFPDRFIEYLLTKSECLFKVESEGVIRDMNISIELINEFVNEPLNKIQVKNKFTKINTGAYNISVNNINFDLIPAFYLGANERESIINTKNDWGYYYCLSFYLNSVNKARTKAFGKRVVGDELIHSQNDIYVALIASEMKGQTCGVLSKCFNNIFYANQLVVDLNQSGYSNLSSYLRDEIVERCETKPMECYYMQMEKMNANNNY